MNRQQPVGTSGPPNFSAPKNEKERNLEVAPGAATTAGPEANTAKMEAAAPEAGAETAAAKSTEAAGQASPAANAGGPPVLGGAGMPPPQNLGYSPLFPPHGAPGGPNMPGQPPYGKVVYSPLFPPPKAKEPFHATLADALFGIWCLLVLGAGYIEWMFFSKGWGAFIYTCLYAAGVLVYGRAKGVKPAKESWFWLGLLLATGFSVALWPGPSMWFWQCTLLYFLALYWCGGCLNIWGEEKTGNWFLLDFLNLMLMTPFRNFGNLWRSTVGFAKERNAEKKKEKCAENAGKNEGEEEEKTLARWKTWGSVALGLVLSLLFLALVMPLLFAVDGGNFTALAGKLGEFLDGLFSWNMPNYFMNILLGLPVAFYLCGLVAGGAHKRCCGGPDRKRAERNLAAARLAPKTSVLVLLGVALLVYLLFIGCQVPHYFSAFAGKRPPGMEVYSEVARGAFAELCGIVAINLVLLAGVAVLGKQRVKEGKLLRALMAGLLLCTLFFVAVGLSKMALYIGAYGLSPARMKTMVFMVYLGILCLGAGVLLWRRFSIARLGLTVGCALLCLLCLAGPEGVSAQYNAWRFTQGSLKQFDTGMMWESNYLAVRAGLRVYPLADGDTREEIRKNTAWMVEQARWHKEMGDETISGQLLLQDEEIQKLVELQKAAP